MTFLSRKADYALLILSYLSQSTGSAREIAARFELSRAFVANILKELAHAGLVTSTRGVNGGYNLHPAALDKTFSDLLDAFNEGFRLTACSPDSGHAPAPGADPHEGCSLAATCPVKTPLATIHRRIAAVLSGVTLRDLLTPAAVSPAAPPLLPLIDLGRFIPAAPDPHRVPGA